MNILTLSYSDNGGNCFFLAQAINAHTEHTARSIRMEESYLHYPHDILKPGRDELLEMIEWADVVHVRENWHGLLPYHYCKPTVVTYSGNFYRRNPDRWHEQCKKLGFLITVSTVDLSVMRDAPWMPNTRPDECGNIKLDPSVFRVCHTPTFRDRKGTETVIAALKNLPDVELVLVEKRPYADSREARRTCHLTIDQFRWGYGNSAIEAWACAQPVLSDAHMDKRVPMRLRGMLNNVLPWYPTPETVQDIRDAVIQMRDDSDVYCQNRRAGRSFYQAFHSQESVVQCALGFYEAVLDGH